MLLHGKLENIEYKNTVLHQLMTNFSLYENSANQKRDRKLLFSDWLKENSIRGKLQNFQKIISKITRFRSIYKKLSSNTLCIFLQNFQTAN
jgi:hypothetical protein